jgi:hypothetical protein
VLSILWYWLRQDLAGRTPDVPSDLP